VKIHVAEKSLNWGQQVKDYRRGSKPNVLAEEQTSVNRRKKIRGCRGRVTGKKKPNSGAVGILVKTKKQTHNYKKKKIGKITKYMRTEGPGDKETLPQARLYLAVG